MHQRTELIGFLGRDPEQRYTPEGNPVTTFPVATSRKYKNAAGEQVSETTWWRITTWGKQAENCNAYLHKGSKVFIEGRLQPGPGGNPKVWTAKDGRTGANYEVTANLVLFLSGKDEETMIENLPDGAIVTDLGEDIPF